MSDELDPEKVRQHGPQLYRQGVDEYARNAKGLSKAVMDAVQNLRKAADGFVDLLATLEVEHRQLDDVAEQLNPMLSGLGLPEVGPTPDHAAAAVNALPLPLRDVAHSARRSRGDVLDALAAAAKSGV